MKTSFTLIALHLSILTFAQSKTKTEPLIIKGQIKNCTEKELIISFRDKNEQVTYDTIRLDEAGQFFLKTYKIKGPQQTSIRKNQVQINFIFVAPGYNLNITADARDRISLINSLQIIGIGNESNRFRKTLDSIIFTNKNVTPFYKLNTKELLSYMQFVSMLRDSLYHLVYDKPATQDKYHKHFAGVVKLDNLFWKLNLLVVNTNFNYRFKGSGSLIKDNIPVTILNNLYKDEYLISEEYRNLIIGSNWVTYLMNMDYQRDSNLLSIRNYKYRKVNEVYKGKVKELAIYTRLESDVYNSKSLQDINELNEEMDAFLSQPYNPVLKKNIETIFSEQKMALERTMTGQPAPGFALKTIEGKEYNLTDFKGKVVYMDLWASWCGACREQNPSLKRLYEKYKNDDRIVILGIDVKDGYNDWKKAMEHDKPTWLQLRDEDDKVWKSYIAYGLPKFIVIDKGGKIVDFNAPWPDSGKEIETLLNREIEK